MRMMLEYKVGKFIIFVVLAEMRDERMLKVLIAFMQLLRVDFRCFLVLKYGNVVIFPVFTASRQDFYQSHPLLDHSQRFISLYTLLTLVVNTPQQTISIQGFATSP